MWPKEEDEEEDTKERPEFDFKKRKKKERPPFHGVAATQKGARAAPALVCAALVDPRPAAMAHPLSLSIFHHHPSWPSYCRFFMIALIVAYSTAASDDNSDTAALLKFMSSVEDPSGALSSWIASTLPCSIRDGSSWTGVICSHGSVWGLQLEHMGLRGQIDVDSLARLRSLRSLSFMNNSFGGPIPTVNRLGALKALFLSNNMFTGEIPDGAFNGMMSLKKLHLAHNQFTGKIPESLVQLPRLIELKAEENQFTGPIPDFKQKLQVLNLSGNSLEGPIPASLSKLDPSSFAGENTEICLNNKWSIM